jgi:hypothetical protein
MIKSVAMQAGGNAMGIVTYEGIVDHGQIRLTTPVRLPDNKVYIVVPDIRIENVVRLASPRLAHPEQIADFKMQAIEESSNANL